MPRRDHSGKIKRVAPHADRFCDYLLQRDFAFDPRDALAFITHHEGKGYLSYVWTLG